LDIGQLWPRWVPGFRSAQFAIVLSLFALLSLLVASGITSEIDLRASLYISNLPAVADTIAILTIAIASLGDVVTLVLVAVVLSLIKRTRRQGLILLITILSIVILLTYIKPIIARENPDFYSPFITSNATKGFVMEGDTLSPASIDYSYPSNHVSISTAFAFILGYSLSRKYRIAGLLIWIFPFIVALARILLVQHYITDAIGGFLFGLLLSITMSNVMRLERKDRLIGLHERS
jgi:undecaprenyl-diphosphatase